LLLLGLAYRCVQGLVTGSWIAELAIPLVDGEDRGTVWMA